MQLGFESWKDWFSVLGVPVGLAAAGGLYQLMKRRYDERAFLRLVLRELEEVGPWPTEPISRGSWEQHQRRTFVHQKIFDNPSQTLLLGLPPDLVYIVNQLWSSRASSDAGQWLYCLGKLSAPAYDKRGRIGRSRDEWEVLLRKYELVQTTAVQPPTANPPSTAQP